MTHPAYLRDKAITLRTERRMTIDEIAERLALSRSTIFYWVRDIPIPRRPSNPPPHHLGNAAMQRKHRRLREAAYERGLEEFDELLADPTFRDFVGLFITEGYKRNRNRIAIANSDPAVVFLAHVWLRRLSANPLAYSIQHHADQDLGQLRDFWSCILGVDAECIRFQRKSNSGQLRHRTWRCRHGVITVCANDTLLRSRMQAWVDLLRDDWGTLEL